MNALLCILFGHIPSSGQGTYWSKPDGLGGVQLTAIVQPCDRCGLVYRRAPDTEELLPPNTPEVVLSPPAPAELLGRTEIAMRADNSKESNG
jgi:hypothetical protein